MAIGTYAQEFQHGFRNVPCILMDKGNCAKAQQQDDQALGQFQRRHCTKPGEMPTPRCCFDLLRCRLCMAVHEEIAYLPGRNSNCSAGENTRPRISRVLASEVKP